MDESSEKHKTPQIMQELEQIRLHGSLQQLPRIVEVLRSSTDYGITRAATSLLADIKDQAVIPLMMDQLALDENQPVRKELIQACWESGLNYEAHLMVFAHLFITEPYEVALEAFTLIENTCLDHQVQEDKKKELAARIKSLVLDLSSDKQNLAMELIHVLLD